ncbi:hypothetical protein BDF14DRAFT_1800833 [Spinellus fusiger]|nr:hypothetical protein BDF14DRAFT_1800833 [Spinellus fusiger]
MTSRPFPLRFWLTLTGAAVEASDPLARLLEDSILGCFAFDCALFIKTWRLGRTRRTLWKSSSSSSSSSSSVSSFLLLFWLRIVRFLFAVNPLVETSGVSMSFSIESEATAVGVAVPIRVDRRSATMSNFRSLSLYK